MQFHCETMLMSARKPQPAHLVLFSRKTYTSTYSAGSSEPDLGWNTKQHDNILKQKNHKIE